MPGEYPKRFGKYLLVRKIAVGGMAEVFLAKVTGAEGFQRTVVVKRILPSYSEDESFVSMFIDEARIAAALHHANIIQVLDFDKIEDCYYIAMEYVEGRDLRKVLDKGKKTGPKMSPVLAAHVASLVAAGLHYAHTRRSETGEPLNIVHRDVSPQNILVSFAGDVKLTDFGIAKAAARCTKTQVGLIKGKCAYMSPEQAKGKPIDARSDIFALSAVLWEMLTYRRLFEGDNDFEILNNVLNQSIPPPSLFSPEVVRDLDAIVLRGLARALDERYQDMAALERDLQNFVFRHASSRDDIDIGAYMRALFADELEAIPEYSSEKTPSGQAIKESPKTMVLPEADEEPATVAVDLAAALPSLESQSEPAEMVEKGAREEPSEEVDDKTLAIEVVHSREMQGQEPPPTVAISSKALLETLDRVSDSTVREPTGKVRVRTESRQVAVSRKGPKVVAAAATGLAALVLVFFVFHSVFTQSENPSATDVAVASGSTTAGLREDAGETPDATLVALSDHAVYGRDTGEERGFAEIEIVVVPWKARVFLNSKEVTLLSGRAVVSDVARVGDEIDLSVSAKGFVSYERRVRIEAQKQRIEVVLERERRAPGTAEIGTGFVNINARPWADVYYRGRKIGTTPVWNFRVPVGPQKFVLKNKDTTRELTVIVEKGQTVTRVVDM